MRKTMKLAIVVTAIVGSALQPAAADSEYTAQYNDGDNGVVSVTSLQDRAGTKSGKGATASCAFTRVPQANSSLTQVVLTGYAGSGSNTGDVPSSTGVFCSVSAGGQGLRAVSQMPGTQAVAVSTGVLPAGPITLCGSGSSSYATEGIRTRTVCAQSEG